MSDVSPRRPAPARARIPYWVRWTFPFVVGALLIFGLVRFVQSNNSTAPANLNPSGEVQANRESAILVAQDQAPHTARLHPGAAPAAALAAAVRTDILNEIIQQQIYGSLGRSACTQTGFRGKGQLGFNCAVAVNGLPYPFAGVVDLASGVITYCKRDPPPVPSETIPLSPRCLLAKASP